MKKNVLVRFYEYVADLLQGVAGSRVLLLDYFVLLGILGAFTQILSVFTFRLVIRNLHDGISGQMGFYCPLLAKVMAALCLSKDADDGPTLAVLSHDGISGQMRITSYKSNVLCLSMPTLNNRFH